MSDLNTLLDRIEEKQKVEGQIQVSTNGTSLDFFQAIYRDPGQPIQRRMRAAQAAIAYEHPKLAVTAQVTKEDFAEVLGRALQASQKVINSRPMQVISSPVKKNPVEVSPPPDHSKPFAVDNKSRFRRI